MGADNSGVMGGVWSGAYRVPPWHGVGDSVDAKGRVVGTKVLIPDGVRDGAELLRVAGMDWRVAKKSLADLTDMEFASDHDMVIREDKNRVLGMVSPRYGLIQNSVLGDWATAIMQERSDAHVVSVVELWGGKTIFMVIEFDELVYTRPGGDENDTMARYVGLCSSHNTDFNLMARFMNTLWVCQNTFAPWAAISGYSVKHTRNGHDIAVAATATVASMVSSVSKFDAEIERLCAIPVTTRGFSDLIRYRIIGAEIEEPGRSKTIRDNKLSDLESEWHEYTRAESALDAIMAVQGYEQHLGQVRGQPRDVATIGKLLDNKWPLTDKAIAVFREGKGGKWN